MYVLLIPFFLGAHVNVDDGKTWTHGAAFTFEINMTLHIDRHDEPLQDVKVVFFVQCQNKDERCIRCRSLNVTVETPHDKRTMDGDHGLPPMEIEFNERGAERFMLPSPIPVPSLVSIREFVALMTLGFDLKDYKSAFPRFEAGEMLPFGECRTKVNVTTFSDQKHDEAEPDNQGKNYRLEFIPLSEKKLIIEKSRITKDCDIAQMYNMFFEFRTEEISQKWSNSKLVFSESGVYESYGDTMVKFMHKETRVPATIRETTSIILRTIEEATGPLPEIENARNMSYFIEHMPETNYEEY